MVTGETVVERSTSSSIRGESDIFSDRSSHLAQSSAAALAPTTTSSSDHGGPTTSTSPVCRLVRVRPRSDGCCVQTFSALNPLVELGLPSLVVIMSRRHASGRLIGSSSGGVAAIRSSSSSATFAVSSGYFRPPRSGDPVGQVLVVRGALEPQLLAHQLDRAGVVPRQPDHVLRVLASGLVGVADDDHVPAGEQLDVVRGELERAWVAEARRVVAARARPRPSAR